MPVTSEPPFLCSFQASTDNSNGYYSSQIYVYTYTCMDDRTLSLSQYEAIVRSFKPSCPGCLDLSPSIFDWRAATWPTLYPTLDPQKVVVGAGSQCMSCKILYAAFLSVGLDLHTLDGTQFFLLHRREEAGSLIASMYFEKRRKVAVELYTVYGETCFPFTFFYFPGYAVFYVQTLPQQVRWITDQSIPCIPSR